MEKKTIIYTIVIDLSGSMIGRGQNTVDILIREWLSELICYNDARQDVDIYFSVHGFGNRFITILPLSIVNEDLSLSKKIDSDVFQTASLKCCYKGIVDFYSMYLSKMNSIEKTYICIFTDGMVIDFIEADKFYSKVGKTTLLNDAIKYVFFVGDEQLNWINEDLFSNFSDNLRPAKDLSDGLMNEMI